jgi:hypothetical protein
MCGSVSRNGHSFTNLFGPISDALRGFPTSILLDGGGHRFNDKGQPDFEALVRGGQPPPVSKIYGSCGTRPHPWDTRPTRARGASVLSVRPSPAWRWRKR